MRRHLQCWEPKRRRACRATIEVSKLDGLYDSIRQAFAGPLPVRAVGVMGDFRTYDYVVGLCVVTSTDGRPPTSIRLTCNSLARVAGVRQKTWQRSHTFPIRLIPKLSYDIWAGHAGRRAL